MAGKNPHEAVTNFLHPLQSVFACFTDAVLDHRGGYDPRKQHVVLLPDDAPITLRSDSDIAFYFSHRYEVIQTDDRVRGPWKVRSLGYRYRIDHRPGNVELVSYHWHPDGKWKFPHLHVHPETQIFGANFAGAHLPTQRMAVEDVLETAVRDFGARPLAQREGDWQRILTAARNRFLQYKTW